ncbi:Sugar efflux transporter [Oligella ureolytica]|uniref:sugar transporter n=1 Tax=Oligella ureolytica TaxID=90244 RepID=UPI000E069A21|nr:sugar transporter [Oligella ureolytica]SUA54962.1 Sugar efflux transporter [Oligella ureolytica]
MKAPIKQEAASESWFAVITLAVAAFIFNTTEFVPVGLLPDIAKGFSMDVAQTGLLMTIYAWAVAIFSLPLTMLTVRLERRRLLILLFCIFIVSHALAAIAWSFSSLLTARLGIAMAHSVFWAITIPLAVRLAPKGNKTKALSFIVTGSSLATVMGVPLGTVIGHHFGWRITFAVIGIIAMIILLLLWRVLPTLSSQSSGNFKVIPSLLKRPSLQYIYLSLALVMTAHFTASTYISPYLQDIGGMSNNVVVMMLFVIGLAGIVGGILFARYAGRYASAMLFLSLSGLMLSLALFYFSLMHWWALIPIAITWGIVITLISMLLQSKVLEKAPDAPDIGIAIFSAVFNIGIGGGALLGGQMIEQVGLANIAYVGAALTLVALLGFFWKAHLLK